MRRLSQILFLCLFTIACLKPALAADPAGIVLFMESDGEVFILLADHADSSTRGWSAFGGSGEGDESPAETAARESEEETRGYFPRTDLLAELNDLAPVVDGTFHMYFLETGFVPAQRIANNIPVEDTEYYRERGPYAWIPYSEVRKHLVSEDLALPCLIDDRFLPAGVEHNWFWSVWINNMRLAFREGAIPWERADG